MNYSWQYIMGVAVTLVLTTLTLSQAAAPALGLDERMVAVLGIVAGVLGTLNGFLPRVQRPPEPEREGQD